MTENELILYASDMFIEASTEQELEDLLIPPIVTCRDIDAAADIYYKRLEYEYFKAIEKEKCIPSLSDLTRNIDDYNESILREIAFLQVSQEHNVYGFEEAELDELVSDALEVSVKPYYYEAVSSFSSEIVLIAVKRLNNSVNITYDYDEDIFTEFGDYDRNDIEYAKRTLNSYTMFFGTSQQTLMPSLLEGDLFTTGNAIFLIDSEASKAPLLLAESY